MLTWTIVFIVVAAVLIAVWIGNTIRWTKQNNTLGRKSPGLWGRRDGMRGDRHDDRPRDVA